MLRCLAVEKVEELKPDVLLMDIRMPGMDGIDAVAEIQQRGLPTRVVMVTTYGTSSYLLRALAAGAAGFVLKSIPADELIATVQDVANGESRVDEAFLSEVLSSLDGLSEGGEVEDQPTQPLTTREREVLQLIVGGFSNQAIAIALGISVHTLKGYVQAIFQKLLVTDRTQAAVKAIRLGLV